MVRFGDPRLPRRFWDKIEIDEGGCWRWTGYTDRDGYPRYAIQVAPGKSRSALAHRVAFVAANECAGYFDARLDGLDVHHVGCGVRDCVNPAHLALVEHGSHGYYHGKMKGYVHGVCTGGEWCLCRTCCDEKAAACQ